MPAKEEEGEKGAPEWMVIYGDSITLLVTFFVLLLTFSSMEEEVFGSIATSIAGMGKAGIMNRTTPQTKSSLVSKERLYSGRFRMEGSRNPGLADDPRFDREGEMRSRWDFAKVTRIGEARVLSVASSEVFLGSSACLSGFGRRLLEMVGGFAGMMPCDIVVCEGETEGVASSSRRLGSSRTSAVIGHLAKRHEVSPGRLLAGTGLLGGGRGRRTLEIAMVPHRETQ